eukprot:c17212_g1_i2 orf=329-1069(-)
MGPWDFSSFALHPPSQALNTSPASLSKTLLLRQRYTSCCTFPLLSCVPGQSFLRSFRLGVFAISSNDFRIGTAIEINGAPWRVQEFMHVKPGKGAAFVRTKLRNYITGNIVEKTFRAGQDVDEAMVQKVTKQFTYKDGDQYVFMDMATFEELRMNEAEIGTCSKWLKEGTECSVLSWNGQVIHLDLPTTIKCKIVETEPGLRGDTVQGGSKPATVDTGAVVTVPLFVNVGDEILVDTRAFTYSSRA